MRIRGEMAKADGSTPARWTPSDYVRRRVFCPIEEIERRLRSVMQRSRAQQILLITFDQRAVLRTLTFVAGVDQEAAELRRLVAITPTDLVSPDAQHPFWTRIQPQDVDTLLKQAADSKLRFLGPSKDFYHNLLTLHRESPWRLDYIFDPEPGVALNSILLRRGGQTIKTAASVARGLATHVNATANASVYRDSVVASSIQESLNTFTKASKYSESTPADFIALARRITNSAGVAFFEYDPAAAPSSAGLLAARHAEADGVQLATNVIADTNSRSGHTVRRAFKRHRIEIRGSERSPETDVSGNTWVSLDGSHVHEIAVPVPSAPGTLSTQPLGVLALVRRGGEPYGDYDLALVTNIALRISLLTAAHNMAKVSTGVTTIVNEFTDRSNIVQHPDKSEPKLGVENLPIDLREMIPASEQAMIEAAALMRAHTATIRLLVPVLQGNKLHYVLQRIAVWPDHRRGEEGHILALDDQSVNGWCANHGRAVSLGNMHDPAELVKYRNLRPRKIGDRRSKAELCIPVTLEGRVLGTVNFESPSIDGFTTLGALGEACAALIALNAHAVRRRHWREILALGEDTQMRVHDLAALQHDLGKTPPEGRSSSDMQLISRVSGVVEDVMQTIMPRRPQDIDLDEPQTSSFSDFIKAVADKTRLGAATNSRSVQVQVSWSDALVKRLHLVVAEVFENVKKYRLPGRQGTPWLSTRETVIGGKRYAELSIEAPYPLTREPPVPLLYRAPIEREDRLHFGALTANILLRSVGGDITVVRGKTNSIIILVSIPAEG